MIRRKVVKKALPPLCAPATVQTTAEWEEWVVRHADYFTTTRRIGPGQTERRVHETLAGAIKASKEPGTLLGHRGWMVYACTNAGRSVMIGPKQYPRMLQLRGEG